jgi:hypothetical protein
MTIKGGTDGADAAVHHVAWGDEIGAGIGVADGGAGEEIERGIVEDAGLRSALIDDAAMAVGGVFAEADVGDHEELGQGFFEELHGLLDDAVAMPCARSAVIFTGRKPEEQHGGNPKIECRGGVLNQFIWGKLKDAGHGGDGLTQFFAGPDEEREDELPGIQMGFGNETAQRGGLA